MRAWKSKNERDKVLSAIEHDCCRGCDSCAMCETYDTATDGLPDQWIIVYDRPNHISGLCRNRIVSA